MLTIVWDVDDVLNQLMRRWFEDQWLPSHPECRLSYSDITENPPHRLLSVTKAEYLSALDRYRTSEAARRMQPRAEIADWLARYGREFRHLALTARPLDSAACASEWVFRHFGGYIRAFGVVPSRLRPGEPLYDSDKSEFLQWLRGADVLVDDGPENIERASRAGIQGVLFPQPWNQSTQSAAEVLDMLAHMSLERS
jgi:hypothetical protein